MSKKSSDPRETLRAAFITACMKGHRADLDKLVSEGAKPDERDTHGASPLFYAVAGGNLETVQALLERRANVNAALTQGFVSAWDSFPQGATPLTLACMRNFEDIAMLLVKNGADVNAKDAYNLTALHYAAKRGNRKLVDALLAKGADINAKGTGGCTAEFFARENGFKELADYLKKKASSPPPRFHL